MAIALDNVNNSGEQNAATGSFSHTCTGSNLALVAVLGFRGFATGTSFSYGGSGLTQAIGLTNSNTRAEIWYLLNPATGANTLSWVLSTTGDYVVGCYSLTGVGGLDATGSNSGAGTAASASLTTIADNSWTIASLMVAVITTPTITSPAIQDYTIGNAVNNGQEVAGHNGPITPAGSSSIAWTIGSNTWVEVIASFSPFVAAGGANIPYMRSPGGGFGMGF